MSALLDADADLGTAMITELLIVIVDLLSPC